MEKTADATPLLSVFCASSMNECAELEAGESLRQLYFIVKIEVVNDKKFGTEI